MAWAAVSALAVYRPSLRTLICRSRLSPDMVVLERYVHAYLSHGQKLQAALPVGTSLGERLTTLGIDEQFLALVSPCVLGQLRELELYMVHEVYDIVDALSVHCVALDSLTIHDEYGNSDDVPPKPGHQVVDPGESDVPPRCYRTNSGRASTVHALTPANYRHRQPDALRGLTSFKWVAYRDVLPEALCAHLIEFLKARKQLRRLDIKAVIPSKAMAERVLRTISDMPCLEVLGFEFRDQKAALASGMVLVKELPRNITHLKYSVVGWDLKKDRMTAEDLVRRIVSQFPNTVLADKPDMPLSSLNFPVSVFCTCGTALTAPTRATKCPILSFTRPTLNSTGRSSSS
jgi:hypothetical protein